MDAPNREDARRLRAERAFKRQEEGVMAMSEYQAEGRSVRAKTVRLKAQRLAKEAKEKSDVTSATNKAVLIPAKPKGRAASAKAAAKAAEMASQQIDRLGDQSTAQEQRASRKRRLLKGPKEFRNIRDDLPAK